MEKSTSTTGAIPKSTNKTKTSTTIATKNTAGNERIKLDSLQQTLQESVTSFPNFKDMMAMKPVSKNYMRNSLLFHQLKSLALFTWREQQPFPGGFLSANDFDADLIIPLLALVAARKDCAKAYSAIFLSRGAIVKQSNTTLLICKASKIGEWEKIIAQHSRGLKVEVYHGPTRSSLEVNLHLQDIVITSYETVRTEIGLIGNDKKASVVSYFEQTQTEEMSKSVLLRIHFHRIILDQAEEIKNSTSAQSVSVCRIRSTMKWVIFPDGIRDEEMYGFVRFLKISPLDDNSLWKQVMCEYRESSKKNGSEAVNYLQLVLEACYLRRTPDDDAQRNEKLTSMPKIETVIHEVDLDPTHRKVYDFLEHTMKTGQKDNTNSGINSTLALRLRQLCSAPGLLTTMLKQEKEAVLIKDAIPKEQDRKSFFYLKNTTTKLETVVALVLSIISKEDETDLSVEPNAVNETNTQVIIVSHWITVLDVLKRKLGDQSKLISKEILPLKRTEIIESFNEKRSNIKFRWESLVPNWI